MCSEKQGWVFIKCKVCGDSICWKEETYEDAIYILEDAGWRWYSGPKNTKGWRCPMHADKSVGRQISYIFRDIKFGRKKYKPNHS